MIEGFSPYLGKIATMALKEASAYLFDEVIKQDHASLVSDITNTVLKRLKSLDALYQLDEPQLEATISRAQSLITEHGMNKADWARCHFDPQCMSETLISFEKENLAGSTIMEANVFTQLLPSFYEILFSKREILDKTEQDFRTSVLSKLNTLPQDIFNRLSEHLHPVSSAFISIPERIWDPELSPPGALLRAEYGIVPFHGREGEVEDLLSWCQDKRSIAIKLLTGVGGVGKTRMMIELSKIMDTKNWVSGFVNAEVLCAHSDIFTKFLQQSRNIFLVMDYAETEYDAVVQLVKILQQNGEGNVRLVLLARSPGDWWQKLKTESGFVGELFSGPAVSKDLLSSDVFDIHMREHSFKLAAKNFASILGIDKDIKTSVLLEENYYDRILFIHILALASVLDEHISDEDGLLDFILNREKRFWQAKLAARMLPDTLFSGMGIVMAMITLSKGVKDKESASELIRQVNFYHDQTEDVIQNLSLVFHDLYHGKNWINPIEPDLLGEHLVQIESDDSTVASMMFDTCLAQS